MRNSERVESSDYEIICLIGCVGLAGLLSGPQGFSGAFRGLGVVFRGSLGQGVLKGSLGPMGFSGVLLRFSRGLQRLSGGSEVPQGSKGSSGEFQGFPEV